jgi:acyl-CoA synthetase (AMP-forming)/AMP-acid ligase II
VAPRVREIEAQLTGCGGPFEVRWGVVGGERLQVFANRAPHLRAVLTASARFGNHDYLVFDRITLSYRDHLQAVASVARGLVERFGVEKGDRVAILAANCPEWIVTFWAAVSLGAIPVGMNAWWARDEIRFALADCEPKVVIVDEKRRARMGDAGVPVVSVEDGFAQLWRHDLDAPLPTTPIDEDDAAAILYTSGTTGRAKGVVNTHRNVIALCTMQLYHGTRCHLLSHAPAPTTQRCQLVGNPLFHVSGLYTQVVTSLMSGARTIWTSGRYDPQTVLQLIARERVTGWSPHGSMAPRLLAHPDLSRYDLSSVVNIGSGGAPVPPSLQAGLRAAFPNARPNLTVGYGLTECTALACINFGDELAEHPSSVGRPLPTVEIEVRDAAGAVLRDGRDGEIHVRSAGVMKEYWRRPDETRAAIGAGRWLRTGDIGRICDGLLYIDSRQRDLILRGAENVYPGEIEARLEAHPSVKEAAVVGVAHPELGQEVKAIVVPRDGVTVDTAALAGWVREALAYFKVPVHWELRELPLPRNATGKVMKHVLLGEAAPALVED